MTAYTQGSLPDSPAPLGSLLLACCQGGEDALMPNSRFTKQGWHKVGGRELTEEAQTRQARWSGKAPESRVSHCDFLLPERLRTCHTVKSQSPGQRHSWLSAF